MTKLILAFLNFANTPKNYVDRRTLGKYVVTGNARNPELCVDETYEGRTESHEQQFFVK